MELKEDDFTLHQCTNQLSYIYLDNYNPHEMIEQILKNQEFVEKCVPIMERLKKRIEELEGIKSPGLGVMIRDELQKILGEGK